MIESNYVKVILVIKGKNSEMNKEEREWRHRKKRKVPRMRISYGEEMRNYRRQQQAISLQVYEA